MENITGHDCFAIARFLISLHQFVVTSQSDGRNLTQPASDGYLLPFLYPTKRTHVASPHLRQDATYTTETLEWSRWLKMGLSAAKLGKAVLSADAWPRGASVRLAGSQGEEDEGTTPKGWLCNLFYKSSIIEHVYMNDIYIYTHNTI